MRLVLIACLCAGLAATGAIGQTRAPRTITKPATGNVALISAPNQSGGYGCPGCMLYASLDAEIEPENPLAPVRAVVNGIGSFVWLRWKTGVYFEVPAEIQPARGGLRWASVEIEQGEKRFRGTFPVVRGAPLFAQYTSGQIAGLWRYGEGGGVNYMTSPVIVGPARTYLLLQVVNLGIETLRTGRVRLWIGAQEFVGEVGDAGFPGISNLGVLIEPGQLEPGEHRIVVWSGRWSGVMPPVRFVAAP